VTGGPGGRSDVWAACQKLLAADTKDRHIEGVRQPLFGVAIQLDSVGQVADEALVEAVAQAAKPVAFVDQLCACDARCCTERYRPCGFSVPARRPCSWPPPRTSGSRRTPGRT
jgi:hypothetical protein